MKKKLYGPVLAGLMLAAAPGVALGSTSVNWFNSLVNYSNSWFSINFSQGTDTNTNTSTVTDSGGTRTYHYVFGTGMGSSLDITITITLPQMTTST